jgi:hypothetical protein
MIEKWNTGSGTCWKKQYTRGIRDAFSVFEPVFL